MKRILSLWAPVAVWAGLIFLFSSIPDLNSGLKEDFLLRKAAHMIEYSVLAGFFWRALRETSSAAPRNVFALTVLFCVLYAASDEWHQRFVSGRVGSARDVAIDSAGALAACLFLGRGSGRRKKSVRSEVQAERRVL